jgi:hypothetical protein
LDRSGRNLQPTEPRAAAELLLTSGKVYLVRHAEKLRDQKVWTNPIRDNGERRYLFEFTNEDGSVIKLGLDLDDERVVFLAENNLKQVLP